MEFWMSGEVQSDIGDQFLECLRFIEGPLNEFLNERNYGSGIAEWSFIPIIIELESVYFYKEIKRYKKSDRSCEFRLHINHEVFRSADFEGRVGLLCQALLRSLVLLEKKKIPNVEVAKLKSDFLNFARSNRWFDDNSREQLDLNLE